MWIDRIEEKYNSTPMYGVIAKEKLRFNDCDLLLARGKNSPIHFMIVEKTADKNKKIIHTTRENGFSCCVNFDYNLTHFIDKMFVLKDRR